MKYEKSVNNVHDSILYIPGVSSLLTLAWIKDVDLRVKKLDETFFNSLSGVKKGLNELYPKLGFKGKVKAEETRKNNFNNKDYGIYFSAGADSTCLYLKIRKYKPELFTILGAVTPLNNHKMIKKIRQSVKTFAEKEKIKINFIETNIREVLNEGLLTSEYAKLFPNPDKTWWDAINHGIVQLGLSAPLTPANIGKMVFATNGNSPHGGNYKIITRIAWSDLEILPEGKYYHRYEKIKEFYKKYVDEKNFYPILKVCNYSPIVSDRFNCCSCEKCAFTITSLLLAGVDPRKSGFPINYGFFKYVKDTIFPNAHSQTTWINIQENIEKNYAESIDYSRSFLETLKNQKFAPLRDDIRPSEFGLNTKWTIFSIFYRLPKAVQLKLLKMFYNSIYLRVYSRAHS